MSHVISIRAVLSLVVVIAVAMLSSPAWSQHGHGGGHSGGHGGGGHGFGGGHGYGRHYGGGHGHGGYGYGGHGIVGHHGGGHGYAVHGGLHGHADYGYGHYDSGHNYGLHGYGHSGYLHGYGYHDYYPHSFYQHYPSYYDDYPYYYWYSSYSASLYPWYGFYDADDVINRFVVNRPVIAGEEAENEHAAEPESVAPEITAPPRSTVTTQGRQYQQRAESAFRGGRFGEALRLANHALVEMPRDGKLLLFVSHTLFVTEDYRGAAAAIHQAATLLDKGEWGYVTKNWRNYYRGSAYRDAMVKLHEYVKENPDAAYARFLRAYHYGFIGQEEFARQEMTKAIELESRDRLAIDLLKMFGGEPPDGVSEESADEKADGHDHDDGDHGHHVASGEPSTGATVPKSSVADEVRASLIKLSEADRAAAARQRVCAVTGDLLGADGPPIKVSVGQKAVFVCCEDCVAEVQNEPGKFLTALKTPVKQPAQGGAPAQAHNHNHDHDH